MREEKREGRSDSILLTASISTLGSSSMCHKSLLQHARLVKNLVSNCFSRFQLWLPQPKPSNSHLGELWDSDGIITFGLSYSKLCSCCWGLFPTSKHTHHGSDRDFLKQCHPPHWHFTEWGILQKETAARALPALEIQGVGYQHLSYIF